MFLWIGHPCLMVSSIDERYLQIRRTAEYGEPEEPVFVTIDRSELKKAINVAKEQLTSFKQVLIVALPKAFPYISDNFPLSRVEQIAERLVSD